MPNGFYSQSAVGEAINITVLYMKNIAAVVEPGLAGRVETIGIGAQSMLSDAKRTLDPEPQAGAVFSRFARWVERQVGRSVTFVLAIAVVLVWAASGPIFDWSDTWQLVINTGTTIVTFLMVFVIQNTQSRDTQAMQVKLDELIRANRTARNSLINLEEMSDADVERMKAAFAALASTGRKERQAAPASTPG